MNFIEPYTNQKESEKQDLTLKMIFDIIIETAAVFSPRGFDWNMALSHPSNFTDDKPVIYNAN